MHYYQHNIGDYRKDTSHLSLLEHGIYRQLMDWYYLEEAPIPKETEVVFRRLRVGNEIEQKAVLNVLADFFRLTDKGYVQGRADAEIAAYHVKADTARANGKTGGRPPKTKPVPGRNPIGSKTKPTGKLTNKLNNSLEEDKSSSSEDQDSRLAGWMFEKVLQAVPGTKPPNFQNWSNTIRLMRERDDRSHREIAEVFDWANKDKFWRTNVLCPDKLREKFPVLAAKRGEAHAINQRTVGQGRSDRNESDLKNYLASLNAEEDFGDGVDGFVQSEIGDGHGEQHGLSTV